MKRVFTPMIFTIDRINAIRKALNLSRTSDYPTHKMIDGLDAVAKVCTRYCAYGAHPVSRVQEGMGLPLQEYLGARLARLERHVFHPQGYMFWLGAEGAPT